jgi:hypothetical protein
MKDILKPLVERAPLLQQPAYWAYIGLMVPKYKALDFAYRKWGYIPHSLSDRGQDRFVIDDVFKGKRGGYFLEMGAADGFDGSNTFVLEKTYGWTGLLIEPNPEFFEKLQGRYNRTATCAPILVDSVAGKQEFLMDGQRSGITVDEADNSLVKRGDKLVNARSQAKTAVLDAMTLEEALDHYNAPRVIDYFSFDVEGAETRIMRNFPFDKYTFLSMTIERPTPEINALLFANGYHFVRNSLYDTFYVHESVPGFASIPKKPFVQLPPKKF